MRLAFALLALLFLLPTAAQLAPQDSGMGVLWERALRDPLVALPLERPADADASIARLDRIAKAFSESQAMLGESGSGPLLRAAAPDAASLRGIGADRTGIAEFLSAAPQFRAGRLGPDANTAATVRLLQVGAFLDRMQGPAQRYPSTAPAWDEANAWYQRLLPMRSPGVTRPGANASAGPSSPGGTLQGVVHGAGGNGTVVTPWGNASVGPGGSEWSLPVPGNQAPGNYTGHLVVGGKTVGNFTIHVDLIPLTLDVLGPRQVAPLSTARYRIAMSSPVLVTRTGTFSVVADGAAVPVQDGTFELAFPASGRVEVAVDGGPGAPWSNASRSFSVDVATPATTSGLGPTGLTLLVAVPSVVLLAAAAALRSRRRTSPSLVPGTAAANFGAAPTAPANDRGLGSRLRAWWSSPDAALVADYRRAARILGDAGRLEPGATHAAIAAALESEGIRPKVARRLASAYERLHYAGLAEAGDEYRQARGGEA